MGFEYESVSDEYISSTLDATLREYLYIPCYNLSTILGDSSGKVNHSTVKRVIGNLSIISPGTVVPEHGITMHDYTTDSYNMTDVLLGQEVFAWEVSPRAYDLYLKYLIMDPEYTESARSTTYVRSPLLHLSDDLNPNLRNSIDSIYLEVMSLYIEILEVEIGEELSSITYQDMIRILNNIRYVSRELECMSLRDYGLIQVFRDLQMTIMTISRVKQIFSETYVNMISRMSSLGGDMDD